MSAQEPAPGKSGSGKVIALAVALAGVSLLTTLMIALFSLHQARLSARDSGAGLSVPDRRFGPAPFFELVERSGRVVHSRELEGKIWLASFTFTRCLGVCPAMNARAKQIQDAVLKMPGAQEVVLVSFTVDPENDTPQVLAARARQLEADSNRWLWLWGPREKIWAIASQGFKLAVEEDPGNPDMPIAHSSKFVLVDRDGRIHGYYDSLDPASVEIVLEEIRQLIHNG